jgi:hypothetical protein
MKLTPFVLAVLGAGSLMANVVLLIERNQASASPARLGNIAVTAERDEYRDQRDFYREQYWASAKACGQPIKIRILLPD